MSELRIYSESSAENPEIIQDFETMQKELADINVILERWPVKALHDVSSEAVLEAYESEVGKLNDSHGFKAVDVVSMQPDHPDKANFRAKFLDEHTHDDFEIRYFVAGEGLFYLNSGGRIMGMLCTAGDLIAVPPGTTHWFDMGPNPAFTAIRFFRDPEGWVGNFTGSDIANNYPLLEN